MGLFVTVISLCLAAAVALLVVGASFVLAVRRGRVATMAFLKRCTVAAIPVAIGLIILGFGFSRDPLWPDQDETPERRVARLSAREFADHVYLVSATFSAGGLLWLSRAAIVSFGRSSQGAPSC